jgi:hypothetical protein
MKMGIKLGVDMITTDRTDLLIHLKKKYSAIDKQIFVKKEGIKW